MEGKDRKHMLGFYFLFWVFNINFVTYKNNSSDPNSICRKKYIWKFDTTASLSIGIILQLICMQLSIVCAL